MGETLKIGDLVKYKSPESGQTVLGHITDCIEDNNGFYMYEVVCTDPFDRGWYSDLQLEVVSAR